MKVKFKVLAIILGAFFILVPNSVSEAVNTADIDRVRNKGVLGSEDLRIIDDFVAEAVSELVQAKDFTSVARVRSVILSRSSSSKESAESQYAAQFSESVYKYLSSGLAEALNLTGDDLRAMVVVNLLILADSLENVRLAELAVGLLSDENTLIRYWAVHCVTNPAIIKQLNSEKAANSALASKIAEQLKGLVDKSSPEEIALMAEFAGGVDIPQGEDLLLQIADMRMSRYKDWTVEYELLDATILKLLYNKMSSTESDSSGLARRFGQLYSYAIQRYVKGRDYLFASEKQQTASVLVEIEQSCVGRILGMPQSVIRKAVEQDNYPALLQEHSRLLGDETRAGQLGLKLNFDYGSDSDGNKRIAPLALPEPPKLEEY